MPSNETISPICSFGLSKYQTGAPRVGTYKLAKSTLRIELELFTIQIGLSSCYDFWYACMMRRKKTIEAEEEIDRENKVKDQL